MPKKVSLDALGSDLAQDDDTGVVRIKIPLPDLVLRCSDPSWAPTVNEVPLPSTSVDDLVDALAECDSSDGLTAADLLVLAHRVAARNEGLIRTVLERFTANGISLDDFLAAAHAALVAWGRDKGSVATDKALATFLAVARKVGLTPAEACNFGRFPVPLVARAVAPPTTVSIYADLQADPDVSYRALAQRYQLSHTTVIQAAQRWGDPHRERRIERGPEHEYDRIRELRSQGLSYRAIQAEVGCGAATVRRALAEVAA